MTIVKADTRNGHSIKYIFENEEEYKGYMECFKSIAENRIGEHGKSYMAELIKLFTDYYNPHSEYACGKPTVTVNENHMITLAALIWVIISVDTEALKKENGLLSRENKLLKEYINQYKTITNDNT